MLPSKLALILVLVINQCFTKRQQFLEMKNLINENFSYPWTAELSAGFDYDDADGLAAKAIGSFDNSQFISESSSFFPKKPRFLQKSISSAQLRTTAFPQNLDLREKYPDCPSIKSVKDQGSCASCWSFSTSTAITDRYCIAFAGKRGASQRLFSIEDPLECCLTCQVQRLDGCKGGYLYQAYLNAKTNGIVTGDENGNRGLCKPYFIQNGDSQLKVGPLCQKSCASDSTYKLSYENDLVKITDFSYGKGEAAMMSALNEGGPISVSMTVYKDFYIYRSGIYSHVYGTSDGGHAVKFVGYGEENGIKYWLAANSWGTQWGEDGFFRIKRGSNECGIESTYFFAGNF